MPKKRGVNKYVGVKKKDLGVRVVLLLLFFVLRIGQYS